MINNVVCNHQLRILAVILVVVASTSSLTAEDYAKLSPFGAVHWNADEPPEVRIDGTWYTIVAIEDVPIDEVIAFCNATWPEGAKKRFNEDLVEVLSRMGHRPNAKVTLKLTELESKKEVTLNDVVMTRENRNAIRRQSRIDDEIREALSELDKNKNERIDFGEVDDEAILAELKQVDLNGDDIVTVLEMKTFLQRALGPGRKTTISTDQAVADCDEFRKQLEERFAYLHANNVDYRSAISAVIETLEANDSKTVRVDDLEVEIGKVITMFIDGHAGPRGLPRSKRGRHSLPFILNVAGDGFVAVNFDRTSLVDTVRPYVVSLDGVDMERWLAAMDPYVCQGSPQHNRRRCARFVEFIDHGRDKLGLPTSHQLRVGLASRDRTQQTVKTFDLTVDRGREVDLPDKDCQVLGENIGYLRLATFSGDSNATELIRQWMPKFEDTKALIIDVRNNGGGSRQALLELFPYLLKTGEAHIGNVCAYRLYRDFKEGHLEARFAYREDDPRWDENELAAIKRFKSVFRPEWEMPSGEFSEWHYLVLSKREGDRRFHYDKPVVLLTNSHCFSATDIFVGAFKGFRNVTIMGQSTGGGSARTHAAFLPNSGIEIRLASMASFQPNGLLYDGRGVAVDVRVEESPQSFLVGGHDNVLDAAVKFVSMQ